MVVPFSSAEAASPGLGTLGTIARLIVGRLRRWLDKQAVLSELHELDQRTLNDLRISPSDFEAIADGSYQREVPWENAPLALDMAKVARFSTERPYQYY
ncbi:MAG: hypothetical protein HYR63_12175 [Proteobacteria bacterium]|nr:hypothetical protein [Pseudomonadota bacterium]MBI3500045.1 hypothetical protein [Pseudomonadota bacterium]